MDRRTFVETLGGMGMIPMEGQAAGAPQEGARKTRVYLLENYFLRNSTQLPRLNDYMSQGLLPALKRLDSGPAIFLEALVASHMPQFAFILGAESAEHLARVRAALREDRAFQRAFAAWENGPEPPYENYSQTLLKATEYSPDISAGSPREKPRIFELRVYHSPTWHQLRALHERFAGPEIRIFHRSGVHPLFYTETAIGANMPNLTYLIPFESLAAREKAWDAFGADPEWAKVRRESIEAHGQISSVIQISLFRATPYSPVR